MRYQLGDWLLGNFTARNKNVNIRSTDAELPGYDGWYNNIDMPEMGAVGKFLLHIYDGLKCNEKKKCYI